ncbi:PAS domain-containing protein [Aestuariispira ectoiniformans]|uniref:PAS domain-containing protein n=1 Tax=Aestuariispira ectoiniformans TaxID=2775080 RepID=UPI00223ABC6C|nr:PAS domain-containing protein [Aestuariispira ectoiniformans]
MHENPIAARSSSEISDPALRKLYDYWSGRRGDRPMPSRADIDPSEIVSLLPHIMMVDVHIDADGRKKHWFRLVGTQVAFGTDPTRTYLEDQVGDSAYGTHITKLFSNASSLGQPLYSEYEYEHPESHGVRFARRLFLPLSEDGHTVNKMLVGQRVESTKQLEKSLWQVQPDMIHELRLFAVRDDER